MNNDKTAFYKLLKDSENDSKNQKEFFQYIKNQDMSTFLEALTENIEDVQRDGITKILHVRIVMNYSS